METLIILVAVALGLLLTLLVALPGLRGGKRSAPDPSELYRQVVEAMVGNESQRAVKLLREISLQKSDDWNAQLLLGDLLRGTGATDKALRIHQTLAASSPDGSQARGRILESVARDLLSMGRPSQALVAARGSLQESPGDVSVWEVIWRAQDALGDDDGAWEALRNVYKKGPPRREGMPSLAEYRTHLGQRAARAGNARAAKQYFKEALRLDPELHVAKVFLGDVLSAEGKEREAIDLWTDFSRRAPGEADIVFRRLEKTLFQLGRFGDLQAIYEEILADDAGHPAALAGLARMHLRRGMHDEAEECLETLLERHPEDRQGRRLLMGSKLSSGKTDEARRLMDEWLERDVPAPAACSSCGHRENDPFVRCPRCGSWGPTPVLAVD